MIEQLEIQVRFDGRATFGGLIPTRVWRIRHHWVFVGLQIGTGWTAETIIKCHRRLDVFLFESARRWLSERKWRSAPFSKVTQQCRWNWATGVIVKTQISTPGPRAGSWRPKTRTRTVAKTRIKTKTRSEVQTKDKIRTKTRTKTRLRSKTMKNKTATMVRTRTKCKTRTKS